MADIWASGAAYEPYVGRWSRLVAREFLNWLSVPAGSRWLDLGCGTGALSQTVLAVASPAEVSRDRPFPKATWPMPESRSKTRGPGSRSGTHKSCRLSPRPSTPPSPAYAMDLLGRWRLIVSREENKVVIEEVSNHYDD